MLPFYLLHQTVILGVGFFVIRWNAGILPKLLIVTAVSFAVILVVYELLIRRFNAVRFVFGMRPNGKLREGLGVYAGKMGVPLLTFVVLLGRGIIFAHPLDHIALGRPVNEE